MIKHRESNKAQHLRIFLNYQPIFIRFRDVLQKSRLIELSGNQMESNLETKWNPL